MRQGYYEKLDLHLKLDISPCKVYLHIT